MVTRRQSVENFSAKMDSLINSAYLLCSSKITAVLKAVTSSRLLYELVTFCLEDFDFEELLGDYSMTERPYPTDDKKTVIAFGFSLLAAVDAGDIDLLDVLNNNYKRNSLDKSYQDFALRFLKPMKKAFCEVADIMIDSDAGRLRSKSSDVGGEDGYVETRDGLEVAPVFARAEENSEGGGRKNYLTCFSDLQTLATEEQAKIMYAKMRENEKHDLIMLLKLFREKLSNGNKEEIRQAYVSYKYAVQNFKKLDSSIDDIGRILRFCGIIS